jgi:hypothetical protein
MLDQVLHGQQPSAQQLEQAAADLVGSLLGRTVTIDEVRRVRQGDVATIRAYVDQYQQHRAARAQTQSPRDFVDPVKAAQIEALKAQGRARAVMGFSKDAELTEEVLKRRYRELAFKHHPDRGGSADKMAKLNEAMELLSKLS